MANKDTVSKILDSAEHMFAKKGFTETSLRAITKEAGVNLAAVNYHFGSKKELIQAVFARFLDPFCSFLDKNLNDMEREKAAQGSKTGLSDVLGVLETTLTLSLKGEAAPEKISMFLSLLGMAYTQSQGHMRRFLRENYYQTYDRVVNAIQSTHPEYSEEDLFWSIHFAVGSMIFTFSNMETLRDMVETNVRRTEVDKILKLLMRFITAGVDAQIN